MMAYLAASIQYLNDRDDKVFLLWTVVYQLTIVLVIQLFIGNIYK